MRGCTKGLHDRHGRLLLRLVLRYLPALDILDGRLQILRLFKAWGGNLLVGLDVLVCLLFWNVLALEHLLLLRGEWSITSQLIGNLCKRWRWHQSHNERCREECAEEFATRTHVDLAILKRHHNIWW